MKDYDGYIFFKFTVAIIILRFHNDISHSLFIFRWTARLLSYYLILRIKGKKVCFF